MTRTGEGGGPLRQDLSAGIPAGELNATLRSPRLAEAIGSGYGPEGLGPRIVQ